MPEEKKVDRVDSALRRQRVAMGLQQAELARELGYSRNYITLMETGRKPVTAEVTEKLTAMLTRRAKDEALTVRETSPAYACQYPAECDLPARLDQVDAEIADVRAAVASMESRLETLLVLLGEPLRARHKAAG
jgi:transcriptional regulator with XRE-family HTH domain